MGPKVEVTRKKTDNNKIKRKDKTINRNLDKRQQQISITKTTHADIDVDRNRYLDEAAPEDTSI
jgi:hypothetical protein